MTDCDSIIYFNEATSAWPRAPGVVEAMSDALARPLRAPGRAAAPIDDAMGRCRQQLAAVLQVPDPTRIVLTTGATSALNLAIFGLRLPHVARVITSRAEHNSVLRPLCSLRARKRIQLQIVGLDQHGDFSLEQFAAALRERASLVVLTHASNVTGRVFDVAPLFRMAKAAGAYTLLDAAQTIGLVPVLPEEFRADLVAFSGHRGLRGPLGTGGLYVAPHTDLTPVVLGATDGHCEELSQPKDMPLRFQAGTPNVPEYIGLCSALRWWQEHGESCARGGDTAREHAAHNAQPNARSAGVRYEPSVCPPADHLVPHQWVEHCRSRDSAGERVRHSLQGGSALRASCPSGHRKCARRYGALQPIGHEYRRARAGRARSDKAAGGETSTVTGPVTSRCSSVTVYVV